MTFCSPNPNSSWCASSLRTDNAQGKTASTPSILCRSLLANPPDKPLLTRRIRQTTSHPYTTRTQPPRSPKTHTQTDRGVGPLPYRTESLLAGSALGCGRGGGRRGSSVRARGRPPPRQVSPRGSLRGLAPGYTFRPCLAAFGRQRASQRGPRELRAAPRWPTRPAHARRVTTSAPDHPTPPPAEVRSGGPPLRSPNAKQAPIAALISAGRAPQLPASPRAGRPGRSLPPLDPG